MLLAMALLALLGALTFLVGVRQHNAPRLDIPLVPALGKQIFGGAAVIAAVMLGALTYIKL